MVAFAKTMIKVFPALFATATDKTKPMQERAVSGGMLAIGVAVVITLSVLGYDVIA